MQVADFLSTAAKAVGGNRVHLIVSGGTAAQLTQTMALTQAAMLQPLALGPPVWVQGMSRAMQNRQHYPEVLRLLASLLPHAARVVREEPTSKVRAAGQQPWKHN